MANRPTPTPLRVVRGAMTPGAAAAAGPAPATLPPDARPPGWLKLSPLARRVWRDVLPRLHRMRVVTEADVPSLGQLCEALADYVEARQVLATEGRTYWSESERTGMRMHRAHPMVAQAADAWRRARLMAIEFGMTPAARTRVGTSQATTEDPAEKWLNQRPG